MIFRETILKGAYEIDPELRKDERGYFARTFCENEFAAHKLETLFVQANTSYSEKKHTLRGMHYQLGQYAEAKLVRCIKGRVWDVIIDLRKDSSTYLQHFGLELTAQNNKQLYVPRGFAHGYITLDDASEITYLVSNFYNPANEAGVRWNDPLFAISWPTTAIHISDKDAAHPDYVK